MVVRRVTRQYAQVLGKRQGSVVPWPLESTYNPFLAPDWGRDVRLETRWQTLISTSAFTGAETRAGQVDRPHLTQSASVSGLDRLEAARVRSSVRAMSEFRQPCPIYPDGVTLTGTTADDGTDLLGSFVDRRFYPGQRVAVVKRDLSPVAVDSVLAQARVGEVASVTSDTLTLVDGLPEGASAGDRVYPLFSAEVVQRASGECFTDRTYGALQEARELYGPSQLPPSWGRDVSALFPYPDVGNGPRLPLFNLGANWAERIGVDVTIDGETVDSGISSTFDRHAGKSRLSFSLPQLTATREESMRLLRFFDSRMGRLHPFYLIDPLAYLDFVSSNGGNTISFTPFHHWQNIDKNLGYVAIEMERNTAAPMAPWGSPFRSVEVHKVSQVVEFGFGTSGHRYSFVVDPLGSVSDPFPPAGYQVVRMAPAYQVRFDTDVLAQDYATDAVTTSTMPMVEVLDEDEYEVENL